MYHGLKSRPGALGVLLFAGGCPANTPPATPAPGPNATARACPSVPATIAAEGRPGLRFTNVALTCGGAGGMTLSISTVSGGAQHFVATLDNGSVFDATAIPVDPFGNDVPPTTGVHITFGLQYQGDQGEELPAGSGVPCITQSKVTYTQFDPGGNPLVAAAEGAIKNNIHQKLDDSVIQALFNRSPSRCARWRQMP